MTRYDRHLTARIDLNHATVDELAAVPVIGEENAKRIVAYRTENGPFHSIDDLLGIPGLPTETTNRLRDALAAEGAARDVPYS